MAKYALLFALLLGLMPFCTVRAGGLMIVAPEGSTWRPDILPHPRPAPPILPPHFKPFPLELRSEKAAVSIDGQSVRTEIEQVFHNPSYNRLEAWFILPLPAGSVIADFSMTVNGKELTAELLDAAKARKIYEDIVRSLRDPALLEYNGQDLFKVRIFPIEPNEDKRVKISYSQILTAEDQTFEYIYPLNTQKYSPSTVGEVAVSVTLSDERGIGTVYCPTHETRIERKGNTATAQMTERNAKNDTDFRLYYTLGKAQVGMSLLTHRPAGEDGFFMLTLTPDLRDNTETQLSKDVSFVLDVSGSMTEGKLDKAKEALLFCIDNLNDHDRFNVIRFSTEARALFDQPKTADKTQREAAAQFVKALKPIGGTNIDEALRLALAHRPQTDRPYIVVFITDGKPTIGTTDENALLNQLKTTNTAQTRIFTVGIGNDLNTHLLDKLTEQTRAFRTYITPEEDIELKLSNFYTKISTPALTDLRLSFGRNIDAYDIQPKALPDLFKGSSVTILGRYRNMGNDRLSLQLSGKRNGKTETYNYEGTLPTQAHNDHDFIPPLWAARVVGYLLDQIRLHGESKELTDEVVKLAQQYGIVTPYTSYLIIEDQAIGQNPPPPPRHIPNPGPFPPHPRPLPMPRILDEKSQGNAGAAASDYEAMKRKEGSESVRSSTEIQALNRADNLAHTRQGQARMSPNAQQANDSESVAQQYRNVSGKAVYKADNDAWIAADVYQHPKAKRTRIQFASDEYFKLLQQEPNTKNYIALGRNVQFWANNQIYEIYE